MEDICAKIAKLEARINILESKSKRQRTEEDGDSIVLKVGNKIFETTRSTLALAGEGTFLYNLARRDSPFAMRRDATGRLLIDRSGKMFAVILDYLRSPNDVKLPTHDKERNELRVEAEFFGLDDLAVRVTDIQLVEFTESTAVRQETKSAKILKFDVVSTGWSSFIVRPPRYNNALVELVAQGRPMHLNDFRVGWTDGPQEIKKRLVLSQDSPLNLGSLFNIMSESYQVPSVNIGLRILEGQTAWCDSTGHRYPYIPINVRRDPLLFDAHPHWKYTICHDFEAALPSPHRVSIPELLKLRQHENDKLEIYSKCCDVQARITRVGGKVEHFSVHGDYKHHYGTQVSTEAYTVPRQVIGVRMLQGQSAAGDIKYLPSLTRTHAELLLQHPHWNLSVLSKCPDNVSMPLPSSPTDIVNVRRLYQKRTSLTDKLEIWHVVPMYWEDIHSNFTIGICAANNTCKAFDAAARITYTNLQTENVWLLLRSDSGQRRCVNFDKNIASFQNILSTGESSDKAGDFEMTTYDNTPLVSFALRRIQNKVQILMNNVPRYSMDCEDEENQMRFDLNFAHCPQTIVVADKA
jgi:hypothetical protein